MTRRAAAIALALGCLVTVPGGARRGQALAAAPPPPSAGPRTTSTVGEATIARSFDELARLVDDPAGPRDIAIDGKVTGDLHVKRPVTLRGLPGAVLEGSGRDTVLTIDAHDVVVEDLAIRRSGRRHTAEDSGIKAKGDRIRISHVEVAETLFGISLQACKACVLEGSRVTGYEDDTELRGDGIKLWEAHGSTVRDCHMVRSRDLVVWYTNRVTLERNVVEKSRYGSHFMHAEGARVRHSRFDRNIVGIFVMYSKDLDLEDNVLAGARGAAGVGLGFKDSDDVRVRRNWMVANTTGTYLDNTPRTPAQPVRFEENVLALNDVAMRLHGSDKGLHVHGNDFRNDAVVIEVDGGSDALGVDFHGNHYTDYEGYDLDRDGVGDVAYEVKMLSSELTESRPALKFFYGTAAMGVIDAVAHAVPVLAAKRLMVDPSPRMNFPQLTPP